MLLLSFISSFRGLDPQAYINRFEQFQSTIDKEIKSGHAIYTIHFLNKEIQVIEAFYRGIITNVEAYDWLNEKENEVKIHFQIEIPENGSREFLKFEMDGTTYEERLNYFAFEFWKDIEVLGNKSKVLKITNYHFERDFGISTKGNITFYIRVDNNLQKIQLTFNDKIYGNGKLSTEFDLTELKSLPKLKNPRKWKN
jgi:hypothetical protein